jgi:hypothetical protein
MRATRAEVENAQFEVFLSKVALPALRSLAEELARHNREATVREAPASAILTVRNGINEEIRFQIMKRYASSGIVPYAEVRLLKGQRYVKYDGNFVPEGQSYTMDEVTSEKIIACFLEHFRMVLDAGTEFG